MNRDKLFESVFREARERHFLEKRKVIGSDASIWEDRHIGQEHHSSFRQYEPIYDKYPRFSNFLNDFKRYREISESEFRDEVALTKTNSIFMNEHLDRAQDVERTFWVSPDEKFYVARVTQRNPVGSWDESEYPYDKYFFALRDEDVNQPPKYESYKKRTLDEY
jgi:hypothetical protein